MDSYCIEPLDLREKKLLGFWKEMGLHILKLCINRKENRFSKPLRLQMCSWKMFSISSKSNGRAYKSNNPA
jgi:hypothetical protein